MLRKLYIEPTTRCNLNCKMCFRNTWFDEQISQLSLEDVRHVINTMPKTVETVFFGGQGEPLFHPDIVEMVALASQAGAEVEIISNGTLLSEEMIKGLIDAGLSRLWVSIDDLSSDSSINASNPAGHDHSGHDHSGLVLSNIRTFNRIRHEKHCSTMLGITFVAMKSNVHQLKNLPFFIAQHLVDEVNVSNISPTDESSWDEMLYTGMVNMYTGPGKGSVLPVVHLPFFDMNLPEAASAVSELMAKQNFELHFNGEPVVRKAGYCKFVREGMSFVRSDGELCPCMALLHNNYTYLVNARRKLYHKSFGNVLQGSVEALWNSAEYRAFRRKFDDFDFSPCIYCGHCELFDDNMRDCFGSGHPACGGCLWAEGVLSCP